MSYSPSCSSTELPPYAEQLRIHRLFTQSCAKLSYDPVQHKKVYNFDLVMALPGGPRCFLWFTMRAYASPTCVLFTLSPTHAIHVQATRILPCCFDISLAYGSGSVFKGTIRTSGANGRTYFMLEDAVVYKGKHVGHATWAQKFAHFRTLLTADLNQAIAESHNVNFILIGLPLMSTNMKQLCHNIYQNKINYEVKYVQYIQTKFSASNRQPYTTPSSSAPAANFGKSAKAPREPKARKHIGVPPTTSTPLKNTPSERTFVVKPSINADVYRLYALNRANECVFQELACVPDLATSVMLNKLFRVVKENDNLDLLEESDTESEFEDESESKFVQLDVEHTMACRYHPTFNKWVPVRVCD